MVFAALIVGASLAEGMLALFERYQSSRIGEGVIYDLRSALFDHVQRLPIAFFTRTQTGTLTNRLNNDVIGAQRALTATLGTVVSNVITLVTTLIAMFIFEWRLTILALILTPFFVLPYRKIGAVQQSITRESMDLNAAMNSTMTERFNVSGALLTKLFGRHDEEVRLFSSRAERVRDIGIRSALFTRAFMIMLGLLGSIGTALVYGLGGLMAINGSFSVGDLAAMGLLVGRIYSPLTGLTNARIDVLTALVSFDRVFEVLDAPIPLDDAPDAIELRDPEGRIEFRDVTFRYPLSNETIIPSLETPSSMLSDADARPVIEHLDLTIEPGKLVALVGPSGAGKTTITNLVPRLYDVTEGAIVVDGHDVREYTQESLRRAIGVVVQDPHLFHESIADNLRYAKPDATDAEMSSSMRSCPDPRGHRPAARRATTRWSASAAIGSRVARSSACRSPACCSRIPPSSSSTRRRAISIPRTKPSFRRPWPRLWPVEPRWSSPTGCRRSPKPIESWCSTRVGSSRPGTHDELIAQGGLYNDLYQLFVR